MKNNNKKVKAYSFGMKQRLGLALALLGDIRLLILDEPFVGLDPIGIETIREFILKMSIEHNMSILISSHQLSEIEGICKRYLLISEGNIKDYEHDARRRVSIYTKKEIPEQIKKILDGKDNYISKKILSFWFDEKVFNDVVKYLVEKNIKIRDIELQKMSLDTLFRRKEWEI